jgi:fermentation-respiration switch protein FrsA (DUF1100 family)
MNVPLAKQRTARERPFYRRAAISLKLLGLVYFSSLGYWMYSENDWMFPGAGIESEGSSLPEVAMEAVDFTSADGTRLHGSLLVHPSSTTALLFCHGNGENMAALTEEAKLLSQYLDSSVLLFDYRGFGQSRGKPTEKAILADAEAASAWLAQRMQTSQDQLLLYGRSLGGGVAIHLASRHQARGLILDRTFSSAVELAARRFWWLPVRLVMRNPFLSIVKIRNYRGPLFQVHGDEDEIIPLWSAENLFAACPSNHKEFHLVEGWKHQAAFPEQSYLRMQQWWSRLKAGELQPAN